MASKGNARGTQRGGLKRSAGSRPRRRAEEWATVLREQGRSGQTVEAFCAERRLARSTFWYWRRRLAVTTAEVVGVDTTAKFLAVPVHVASQGCEVLVNDMRVRLEGEGAQRVVEVIVARLAALA